MTIRAIHGRSLVGRLLAAMGVVILLITLGLYWWRPAVYGGVIVPMAIGAIVGFIGFYMLDPVSAKDGAAVIVESAEGLIAVARDGRRSTDRVVAQKVALPAAHLPDPVVTEEHDG